jgi:hypothetical protein
MDRRFVINVADLCEKSLLKMDKSSMGVVITPDVTALKISTPCTKHKIRDIEGVGD